jgi:hypothetical protein
LFQDGDNDDDEGGAKASENASGAGATTAAAATTNGNGVTNPLASFQLEGKTALVVRLYKEQIQLTHSLKAAWLQPLNSMK